MSARLACIRLWIVGSTTWVVFWLWNYAAKCVRMHNGVLWCPTADGNSIIPTNYLRMTGMVLGPPLATFLLGLLCLWAVRETNRQLDPG